MSTASQHEAFVSFLRDEADDELVALLPDGRAWNGSIPLDRWFPAGELVRSFEDCGYETD